LTQQTSGEIDPLDCEDENQLIAFVNANPKLMFVLCDLKRKTEQIVFTMLDACKMISLEPVDNQLSVALVLELFVGLRVVNVESEQIVHRLRL
jgi:hypothetical protein